MLDAFFDCSQDLGEVSNDRDEDDDRSHSPQHQGRNSGDKSHAAAAPTFTEEQVRALVSEAEKKVLARVAVLEADHKALTSQVASLEEVIREVQQRALATSSNLAQADATSTPSKVDASPSARQPKPSPREASRVSREPSVVKRARSSSHTHCIVTTAMSTEDQRHTLKLSNLMNSVKQEDVTHNTTHLVVGSKPVQRTVKTLHALAFGIPIVTIDWVKESSKKCFWSSEDDFPATDIPNVRASRRDMFTELHDASVAVFGDTMLDLKALGTILKALGCREVGRFRKGKECDFILYADNANLASMTGDMSNRVRCFREEELKDSLWSGRAPVFEPLPKRATSGMEGALSHRDSPQSKHVTPVKQSSKPTPKAEPHQSPKQQEKANNKEPGRTLQLMGDFDIAPQQIHVVSTTTPLVIGRSKDSTIQIPSNNISRKHIALTLTADGKGILCEDLGSMNGFFINRVKTKRGTLREGDTLTLGGGGTIAEGTPLKDNVAITPSAVYNCL
eukprot:PhM_4_TR13499/c0_g1_i1/m.22085